MKSIQGKYKIIALAFIMAFGGCSNSERLEITGYLSYLNNPSNGLVKVKEVNGYLLTAKILPDDYLVYNEIKNRKGMDQKALDSIRNLYADNLTVLFSINKEDEKAGRVIFDNINSIPEWKQRVHEFNFLLEERFEIQTEKESYAPLLATMENTFELHNGTRFYVVFPGLSDEHFTLKYKDAHYNTGISWFRFKKSEIEKIPELIF